MARARNIKPGFFKNPELVEVAFEYRLLFIGLWLLADREGRLENRPKWIRMEIFPADNVDVAAGLQALEAVDLIVMYEVEGASLVWIPGFVEHQHPHPKEVPSTLAPYLGPVKGGNHDLFAGTDPGKERASRGKALANPSDVLNPDVLNPEVKGTVGQRQPDIPAKPRLSDCARRVLDFLNEKTGRRYQPVDANVRLIAARLRDGATEAEMRQVIAKKCREWAEDEAMAPFLRPKTLFSAVNFAQYQGELVVQQEAANG